MKPTVSLTSKLRSAGVDAFRYVLDHPLVMIAEGESVIEYKSPRDVLTDTYDHSCY